MRPMPALLSKDRGRFQGRPLKSSLGGTGFFFFLTGSVVPQLTVATNAPHNTIFDRRQRVRFMENLVARIVSASRGN